MSYKFDEGATLNWRQICERMRDELAKAEDALACSMFCLKALAESWQNECHAIVVQEHNARILIQILNKMKNRQCGEKKKIQKQGKKNWC